MDVTCLPPSSTCVPSVCLLRIDSPRAKLIMNHSSKCNAQSLAQLLLPKVYRVSVSVCAQEEENLLLNPTHLHLRILLNFRFSLCHDRYVGEGMEEGEFAEAREVSILQMSNSLHKKMLIVLHFFSLNQDLAALEKDYEEVAMEDLSDGSDGVIGDEY